jgi:hypothetical protein
MYYKEGIGKKEVGIRYWELGEEGFGIRGG